MNNRAWELVVPNAFVTEGAQLSSANCPAVSIRCPHCRQLGSFNSIQAVSFRRQVRSKANVGALATVGFIASIRICPNQTCAGLVFVIQDDRGVLEIEPPELLDFNPQGLPQRCLHTLKEAVACHGAGAYRAAAMMVRRLLEEICEDNDAEGETLHQRLRSLRAKVVLPEEFFSAMTELKTLGNDATHVEARAYDSIGQEEAEISIELAKEVLKALYQLRGLIDKLTAKRATSS